LHQQGLLAPRPYKILQQQHQQEQQQLHLPWEPSLPPLRPPMQPL
jgi:hypothetical protein